VNVSAGEANVYLPEQNVAAVGGTSPQYIDDPLNQLPDQDDLEDLGLGPLVNQNIPKVNYDYQSDDFSGADAFNDHDFAEGSSIPSNYGIAHPPYL